MKIDPIQFLSIKPLQEDEDQVIQIKYKQLAETNYAPATKDSHHHNNNNIHKNGLSVIELRNGNVQIIPSGSTDVTRSKRKNFLKSFDSPKWFLVFISLACLLQGMTINGMVRIVYPTLEFQFGFFPRQFKLFVASFSIGAVISAIPFAYFGGKENSCMPKLVSLSLVIMGSGSLLFFLPHFIAENTHYPGEYRSDPGFALDSEGCWDQTKNGSFCRTVDQSLLKYQYFFIFGQILHGIGTSPLTILATVIFRNTVEKFTAPVYISVFQSMFIIGPAIGWAIAKYLLTLNSSITSIHYGYPDDVDPLKHESDLWIENWWVGFGVMWCLCWLISAIVYLYPCQISGTEMFNKIPEQDKFKSLYDLWTVLLELGKNVSFILICFSEAMVNVIITCFTFYLPVYLSSQFGITFDDAVFDLGLTRIITGVLATIGGGFLIKRCRLERKGVLRTCVISLGIATPFALNFFTCYAPTFVGVNTGDGYNLSTHCNQMCDCSEMDYYPICGSDNNVYYNPCYAGCTANDKSFNHCNCVATANKGFCDYHCNAVYGFLIMACICCFFFYFTTMPSSVAILKSVRPHQWTASLATEILFIRCLGTIPSPFLLSFLRDRSCLLWSSSYCKDDMEICLFYDDNKMGVYYLSVIIACFIIAIVCLCGAQFCTPEDA